MSARATLADLAALNLPPAATEGMTSGDLQQHLDAASATVDGYLRGRHVLPLSSPPPAEIVAVECNIAAYTIVSRRGFDPANGTDANLRMRYQDALDWCRNVAAGRICLSSAADATPALHDGRPLVRSRTCRTV